MSDRSVQPVLYTIGHSNHALPQFIHLLTQHGVTAVADVRSQHYSRHAPQFILENLKPSLHEARIAYVFLGKELGARSDNLTCYRQGKVQYHLLAAESRFTSGLKRIRTGMQHFTIALMCAEKDPLECHRAILVARYLYEDQIPVQHILADGQLLDHASLEKQMLENLKMAEFNLFQSRAEILQEAYARQGERIAYQAQLDTLEAPEHRFAS